MAYQPVNLIGGFYADDSLPWSAQDTVNLLPFAAEAQGTRSQAILRDAPGLRPFVKCGDGPIRGMRVVEGKLVVVSGNTLYQVSNAGVSIPRGTIPGTGPVSITHNQRGTTNQVLIVNGAAGYVYDTSALTLTKITDEGYPGAFVADFVDGYLAQVEPRRRFWFHSALRNALDYSTLDRYEAEGQPDALVSLIVDHREVWVFGERTIEPFVNTGALTNTFQRASNTVIEQGCSARFSPAKLDNSVLWLDDLGIVRRAQGYTPVRVSTGPIERAIAGLDWSRAFSFTWTDRGHAVYYLTFPGGQTWGYDLVSGLWHRRQSYGLDRWRVSSLVYWNGQWIAGDFREGLLYVLDWAYPHDGSEPLVRERFTGVTHADQARVLISYAELVVDTGGKSVDVVAAPDQPDPPTITGDAPTGEVAEAYSFAYTVGGGEAPLVVRLWSGALPPGLSLSSAGVLSGTPTTAGTYSWTVRVTGQNGLYADLDDAAAIAEAELPELLTETTAYTGTPGALSLLPNAPAYAPSTDHVRLAPNGLYAASCVRDGGNTFRLFKFTPGAKTWETLTNPAGIPTATDNPIVGIGWSKDSQFLALTMVDSPRVLVYQRSGDTFTLLAAPTGIPPTPGYDAVAWADDNSKLAISVSVNGTCVYVWDFDGESLTGMRSNASGFTSESAWQLAFEPGPSPRWLAAGNSGNGTALIDTTASPMPVGTAVSGEAKVIGWSADGDYVISAGSTARVLEANRSTGALTLISSSSAGLPTSNVEDGTVRRLGDALAVGTATAVTKPSVQSISSASPPVLSEVTNVPAGGQARTASWRQ